MQLANTTWTFVEEYLKTNHTLIIPIGSTEQHGPTGLIGTDYITAEHIAAKVGKKMHTLVAPTICYGMARHHLAFPGTSSLAPSTFILVIRDIVDSFTRHGFKKIIFVNGHGGNIAPLTTAFSEIKDHNNNTVLKNIDWWRLPSVQTYENEHFGDENGFHATCGEVAATMTIAPEAFKNIPKQDFTVERPKYHHPLSPGEFRQIFPDGRMMSNPGLSTTEHGECLIELAVNEIIRMITEI